jgi:catechol 2,3-dioxygenase
MRITHLGHIALVVDDLERQVEFYTSVLGFEVSDRMVYEPGEWLAEGVWLRCGSEHHCLALFRPVGGTARGTGGLHHFAFGLSSFDDLVEAHHELKRRGVPIVAERQFGPGCQLRLYCTDPEENRIELYWDLDIIGWDGRARPYPPVENIDLEDYDISAYLEYKQRSGAPSA